MFESVLIANCFVLSDCGISDVWIFRNDRSMSNLLLFWSTASLAPCSKTSPGDFLALLFSFGMSPL